MSYPTYLVHFNKNHDKKGRFTFSKIPVMSKWERDTNHAVKGGLFRPWADEMKLVFNEGLFTHWKREVADIFNVDDETVYLGKAYVENKRNKLQLDEIAKGEGFSSWDDVPEDHWLKRD